MSIDSALIVRRAGLPTVAELAEAIAETGVSVVFPADFVLDRTPPGWTRVEVDGDETGFEYSVHALAELDPEEAPARLRDHGDTMLSFSARGSLSAQTVTLIQQVLAQRWNAAGWIEEELIPAEEMAFEGVPDENMDPDLAASMRGSPAERAAAVDRYVAKFYPPQDPPRRHPFIVWLKEDRRLEFGVFAVSVLAIIIWKFVF